MNFEVQGADALRARFEALMQVDKVIEKDAAPVICQIMRRTAAQHLRDSDAVDTGRLVGSIESQSSEFVTNDGTVVEMGIRTDVPYAQFIEYGTGPLGDPDVLHTSAMHWVYFDDKDGQFHVARSQEARPFMRPALYDNKAAFVEAIATSIEEAFNAEGGE